MASTTEGWRAFGAVAAVAALLALSACGGDENGDVASARGEANPTAEDAEQEPLDEDAQALVFAECMRDNGVDMPDPGPGQEGLSDAFHGAEESYDRATIDQALTACEALLPQRAHEDDAAHDDEEKQLELAECLREQGLDVPDNLFEGGGAQAHDDDKDEFRAAYEECRNVVAAGR